MKLILMYTIEDDVHRNAFTSALEDAFGDSEEYRMLDQSTYAIPGDSLDVAYDQLREICEYIHKELKAFERNDKVNLCFAKNPCNETEYLCTIENVDLLYKLRKPRLVYKR